LRGVGSAQAAALAATVGVAYEDKRPLQYPQQSQSVLLEAAVTAFDRVARESVRALAEVLCKMDRADLPTNSIVTPDLVTRVETEWSLISEQLQVATDALRCCTGAQLPLHWCDGRERDFVIEAAQGIALAIANTLDLFDRAATTVITRLADDVLHQLVELKAVEFTQHTVLVRGTADVVKAAQLLIAAVSGRTTSSTINHNPQTRKALAALTKVLPLLASSLRVAVLHPDQDGVRLATAYAFDQMVTATVQLKELFLSRIRVTESPSPRPEVVAAAELCLRDPEPSQSALDELSKASANLVDTGLLHGSKEDHVLAFVGPPQRALEATEQACRRTLAELWRALAAAERADIEILAMRLSDVSIRSVRPCRGDQRDSEVLDTLDDAGTQMHPILERFYLLEQLASVMSTDKCHQKPAAISHPLGVQIRTTLQSDMPLTLTAFLVTFWLELLGRHVDELAHLVEVDALS